MKKIIIVFIFVISLLFINDVNALTITESTDPTDGYTMIEDNSIIIGVTRFEDGVIVTAHKAATAGVNDALFNMDLEDYSGVNVYYYFSGSWYLLDVDNQPQPLDETEDQEILEELENPDIYYVNNEEKKLIVDFAFDGEGELEFDTDNNKEGQIEYVDGKLYIPATVGFLEVTIKDPDTGYVLDLFALTKDPNDNTNYDPVSLTNYINALEKVSQAVYTEASWATYQTIVADNVVTTANTQEEVDSATEAIINAQKDLVAKLVINITQDKGYDTIQAAIDEAVDGDTIKVASGTYDEVLSINKDLTLQGAVGATLTGGTTITGGNVTIDGFTITTKGILASNLTGLTLENNIFNGITIAQTESPGVSIIGLDITSASGPILINNNEFLNIGIINNVGTAIRMVRLSGETTITGNTIQNVTKNGINIYNYLTDGVDLTITGNEISNWDSDMDTTAAIGGRAIRIEFNSKIGSAIINNNTLTPSIYPDGQTPVDPEYVKITGSVNITKTFNWGSVALDKIRVE